MCIKPARRQRLWPQPRPPSRPRRLQRGHDWPRTWWERWASRPPRSGRPRWGRRAWCSQQLRRSRFFYWSNLSVPECLSSIFGAQDQGHPNQNICNRILVTEFCWL